MGAIVEGVAKSAVAAVTQLGRAGRTQRSIRHDLRVSGAAATIGDTEFSRYVAAIVPAFDPVNPRERRKSLFDAFEQRGDVRFLAPNTQQNALAVIEDFAGKA